MLEVEREIEITRELAPRAPEEQLGVYHLHRWTWYEKQDAVERASVIIDATRGLAQIKTSNFYAEMLATVVRQVPDGIDWNINFIKGDLDVDIGGILMKAGQELNGLTEEERKDFLSPSEAEKVTPS
ncbi:hypothetical protein KKH23_06985 [Patescibacteria group bacterium]|nr:hypothetical protein [Patescibacteria group bacterium]